MDRAHSGPLARQPTADVHQARAVERGADLGASVEDRADLVGEHRGRGVGVLDRERAAEAAAATVPRAAAPGRSRAPLATAPAARRWHAAFAASGSSGDRRPGAGSRRRRRRRRARRQELRQLEHARSERGPRLLEPGVAGIDVPGGRSGGGPSPRTIPRAHHRVEPVGENVRTNRVTSGSASSSYPELACIWPQHVCCSGTPRGARGAPAPGRLRVPPRGTACR